MKKKMVQQFPHIMNEKVITYCAQLREKEEELNDLQKSLSRQLREKHITKVITQNKDNKKRLEKARDLETDECDILRQMVVAPTGLFTCHLEAMD